MTSLQLRTLAIFAGWTGISTGRRGIMKGGATVKSLYLGTWCICVAGFPNGTVGGQATRAWCCTTSCCCFPRCPTEEGAFITTRRAGEAKQITRTFIRSTTWTRYITNHRSIIIRGTAEERFWWSPWNWWKRWSRDGIRPICTTECVCETPFAIFAIATST